ncbi:MAG: type II toxin-antitoxin system Phd/YefM family antitoxin, partial [Verrucomicrobiota bacterium]
MKLTISQAQKQFSKVIAAVEAGEAVIVKRRNTPV